MAKSHPERALAPDCGCRDENTGPIISRRHLARNAALVAGGLAATHGLGTAAAQDASPAASPAASPTASPVASPVTDAIPDPNATFERISPAREDVIAGLMESYQFEEPAQTGGDVIQVFSSDITMLNPMLAQDLASGYITGLVYQSLADVHPDDGTLIPSLADSWEVSSDGLRYRFMLHPDATWHDGEPVTADDVIHSFDAVLAPGGFSPSQGTVERTLASYEKIDDHTVELTARQQSATFLNDTAANVPIMAKHIWESVPFSEWQADPGSTGTDPSRVVGSGLFTFVEWIPGDHITVARNDNYWLPDQVPVIDRYIYRVVAESTSALSSLQAGESDISGVSSTEAPAFIEDNPEFVIHEFDRSHITYYLTNMDPARTEFFLDVRVRQAMLYALDRELIAETIYQGYAVPAHGPQPPLSPAYAPDEITTIYTYDPERARTLLEEAGWTEGPDGVRVRDGEPFAIEFTFEQDSATYQQLIPYIQQSWREVGIEMTPIAMPFAAQQEELNRRDYHTALTGITLNTTGNQGTLFRCDSVYPSGYNEVMYCNPEYDALDDLQRQELDPERREDLLLEAANIIAEEVPMAPLVFASGLVASSPRLHNYFPSGYTTLWSIPWMWVEQ